MDAMEYEREKDKTIKALSAALDKAYRVLEDIQYMTSDEIEEIIVLSEATCEEITEGLINQGVPREYIPS